MLETAPNQQPMTPEEIRMEIQALAREREALEMNMIEALEKKRMQNIMSGLRK